MPSRTMTCVWTGSLWAARRIASRAEGSSTPAISNRTRPGLTTATQWSGAPLPEPIRVSAGFFVTGLSGKTRIQILPPRLTERVIARRAASIWRLVIQAGSRVASPKSPKATSKPPFAWPDIRPRMTLRCLTRFGSSISDRLPGAHRLRRDVAHRLQVAAVDPDLHADPTVGRVGVDLAVADVGAERPERDATFAVPFAAAHLGATEA